MHLSSINGNKLMFEQYKTSQQKEEMLNGSDVDADYEQDMSIETRKKFELTNGYVNLRRGCGTTVTSKAHTSNTTKWNHHTNCSSYINKSNNFSFINNFNQNNNDSTIKQNLKQFESESLMAFNKYKLINMCSSMISEFKNEQNMFLAEQHQHQQNIEQPESVGSKSRKQSTGKKLRKLIVNKLKKFHRLIDFNSNDSEETDQRRSNNNNNDVQNQTLKQSNTIQFNNKSRRSSVFGKKSKQSSPLERCSPNVTNKIRLLNFKYTNTNDVPVLVKPASNLLTPIVDRRQKYIIADTANGLSELNSCSKCNQSSLNQTMFRKFNPINKTLNNQYKLTSTVINATLNNNNSNKRRYSDGESSVSSSPYSSTSSLSKKTYHNDEDEEDQDEEIHLENQQPEDIFDSDLFKSSELSDLFDMISDETPLSLVIKHQTPVLQSTASHLQSKLSSIQFNDGITSTPIVNKTKTSSFRLSEPITTTTTAKLEEVRLPVDVVYEQDEQDVSVCLDLDQSTQLQIDEPLLVESTFNTSSCSNLSDDLIILQTAQVAPVPRSAPRSGSRSVSSSQKNKKSKQNQNSETNSFIASKLLNHELNKTFDKIPQWAIGHELNLAVVNQLYFNPNGERIFNKIQF